MANKQYKTIILSLALLSSINSWGYSCSENHMLELNQTQHTYPNSVLWLNKPINQDLGQIQAISKTQSIDFKYDETTNNIKLIPPKPYLENQSYTLKNKYLEALYSPELLKIQILPSKILPLPKLTSAPILENYEYQDGDGQVSASGKIIFSFASNLDPKDYLVRLRYARTVDLNNAQEFILLPFADKKLSNTSSTSYPALIQSNFGICTIGLQFEKQDHFWIKLDFITHDGKIIVDQNKPVEIKIGYQINIEKQEVPKTWCQKIINAIKIFFQSIFQS